MTREEAIKEVCANVDGDVTKVMEIINDIFDYPEEITAEELVEELSKLFDNGVGVQKIRDLFREVYLKDTNLAKDIHDEISYWRKHEEESKT